MTMLRYTIGDQVSEEDWLDPLHPDYQQYAIRDLCRELNRGNVLGFVGSGVSAAYGYPSWSELVRKTVSHTKEIYDKHMSWANKNKIKSNDFSVWHAQGRMLGIGLLSDTPEDTPPSDLLASLDLCSRCLSWCQDINNIATHIKHDRGFESPGTLSEIVSAIINEENSKSTKNKRKIDSDPIFHLLNTIGVHRFLTTNYDNLLETEGGNYFEFESMRYSSINIQANNNHTKDDSGALFLCDAAKPQKNNKFICHLHGSASNDEKGLIATESSYQRAYLGNSNKAKLFREALELAFDSNTLLFLGVGMREEDLNRVMRLAVAQRAHRLERNIFVIMPIPKTHRPKNKNAKTHRALKDAVDYSQHREYSYLSPEVFRKMVLTRQRLLSCYGARVIFIDDHKYHEDLKKIFKPNGRINHSKLNNITTIALVRLLLEIKKCLDKWWDVWLWTPRVRHANFLALDELKIKKNDAKKTNHLEKTYTRHVPSAPYNSLLARDKFDLSINKKQKTEAEKIVQKWLNKSADNIWKRTLDSTSDIEQRMYLPLVLLTGHRGSGSGSLVQYMIKNPKQTNFLAERLSWHAATVEPIEIYRFFGSTYFSSEFMSVTDAILRFFIRALGMNKRSLVKADGPSTWHKSFETVLSTFEKNRNVVTCLYLTGVERLVDNEGRFANSDLKVFFRTLIKASVKYQGRIQLVFLFRTGRWNDTLIAELLNKDDIEGRVPIQLSYAPLPKKSYSLKLHKALKLKDDDHGKLLKKSISNALGHHRYGMSLLTVCVDKCHDNASERTSVIEEILRMLHRGGLTRQTERVVEYVVNMVSKDHPISRDIPSVHANTYKIIYQKVLYYLSLCPTPIENTTLFYLLSNDNDLVRKVHEAHIDNNVTEPVNKCFKELYTKAVGVLIDCWLVLEFVPRRRHLSESKEPNMKYSRLAVHNTVRKHHRRELGYQPNAFAEPGYFELSSIESSGVGNPALSKSLISEIHKVVRVLLLGIDKDSVSKREKYNNSYYVNVNRDSESKVRCALHLFRSCAPLVQIFGSDCIEPIKTVSGDTLGQLDQHRSLLVRLLNSVRKLSGLPAREIRDEIEERYRVVVNKDSDNRKEKILYADELLWLYNEIAMVSRAQGDLIDASSILSQVEFIRTREQGQNFSGETWTHLEIQRATIDLEMGRIANAFNNLEKVYDLLKGTESILEYRALAYIALADHISGESVRALEYYNRVIGFCREKNRKRSLSIFLRHKGDLLRRQEDYDGAREDYHLALSASSGHEDLFHNVRIALALIDIKEYHSEKRIEEAISYLDSARKYAKDVSMPRMESDVETVLAELRFRQGAYTAAGYSARQALGISSRRGMRLRSVTNLIMLGQIQAKRDDLHGAECILKESYQLAQSMNYAAKATTAKKLLEDIGILI